MPRLEKDNENIFTLLQLVHVFPLIRDLYMLLKEEMSLSLIVT